MSKAFTKESDDDDPPAKSDYVGATDKNYVTPKGFADLQDELRELMTVERPKIVETVSWAAKNGDRSENGDYIYGKRRLREIDRRVRYLTKRIDHAIVVDPHAQKNLERVYFGATVTFIEEETEKTLKIVGIDEADLATGTISWISPVAKALMKSCVGDLIELHTPAGVRTLKVIAIRYV